jgi:hypothetical protein
MFKPTDGTAVSDVESIQSTCRQLGLELGGSAGRGVGKSPGGSQAGEEPRAYVSSTGSKPKKSRHRARAKNRIAPSGQTLLPIAKSEPGLDMKDCRLARDNQIWLSGKQIPMQTCPPDNQIVCFLLIFNTLDK